LAGGQEHRVLAKLKGFQQRGTWVALLAPGHSEVFQRAREAGIEVQTLDTRKSRYPFTALRLKRWLRANIVQGVNTHNSRDGYLVGGLRGVCWFGQILILGLAGWGLGM